MGRIPVPLAALLCVVLLVGVTWALFVPPIQAPDEVSHVGYVQSLVEGPGLPGKPGRAPLSTEQFAAQTASNTNQTAANPAVRPAWSPATWQAWRRQDARLPRTSRADGGGAGNTAASNPPLYYLYAAVPYLATRGDDFFARFTAMRVMSVLWLLVTTLGAWLLAGEIFARDRLLQLVAAASAGLLPMVTFISAQIGPDTMLYALWSLALWLGVRILKRGLATAPAVALLGVTGLAVVTKTTSYALVPAVLLALGIGAWRIRDERPRVARTTGLALAALLAPIAVWFAAAHGLGHDTTAQLSASSSGPTNVKQLFDYLWQYYLPPLPFMARFPFAEPGLPLYHIWIVQGWGAFGWLETRFPGRAYTLLAVVTVLIAVAALARTFVTRTQVDRAVAAFLLTAGLTLLAALHWTDYHSFTGGRGNFMQGRYLFPLVAILGLVVAQALSWAHGRVRAAGAGALLGALVVLQVLSLGLIATRFYA